MNTDAYVQGLFWPELLPGPDDHTCLGRHCAVCEYDTDRATNLQGEK